MKNRSQIERDFRRIIRKTIRKNYFDSKQINNLQTILFYHTAKWKALINAFKMRLQGFNSSKKKGNCQRIGSIWALR